MNNNIWNWYNNSYYKNMYKTIINDMNYLNDINISYTIMYNRIYIIKEYINDSFKKCSNKYICYSLTLDWTTEKKILYYIKFYI